MLERRSFPRPPWEDMDDGESAGAYSIDVWGPRAFELYGVAVIGMVGFEVDSEAAARDQLQGFWNAWGKIMHFDGSNAWDRTDPKKPLPPPTTRLFDDPYADAGVSAQGHMAANAECHRAPPQEPNALLVHGRFYKCRRDRLARSP